VRGRTETEAAAIMADAVAVADAGAFSVVIEKTTETLARAVTKWIMPATIGIGASVSCGGQILVVDDIIGLFTDFHPKFVRRYAEVAQSIEAAISDYASDVRARRFPAPEHVLLSPVHDNVSRWIGQQSPAGSAGSSQSHDKMEYRVLNGRARSGDCARR
jgi:3-methyl-2-oxobutanoate hydroxymethyltransferase